MESSLRLQKSMQLKWGKALDLNYNLDTVSVWARKLQLNKQGISAPDYLGHSQMYWEDQVPEDFWNYLNNVIPLLSMYKEKGFNLETLTNRHWKNAKTNMTSWDLLNSIVPFNNAANSTLSTSLTNIYGNGGTVYQGLSVDPLTGAGTLLFKPLLSAGLQITDNVDHIIIESKAGVNIGVGSASFYAGLNGNQLHQFKSIKSNNLAISESNDLVNIDAIIVSGSLNITASQSNGFPAIQIETPVDVNDKSFYVNQNYVGPEQGTIAKPYRSLRAAIQAFIGAGTKFIPEWRYRGKIVLLSNVYTPSNNTDPNYIDYLDVNFLVIEGGGFELNYSGGMSYFISTKNILYPVNSVFGLASTAIFPFSYGGNGQGPINPTTQRINKIVNPVSNPNI